MFFGTKDNVPLQFVTSSVVAMTLKGGNVGIGVTSPLARLHLTGNGANTGALAETHSRDNLLFVDQNQNVTTGTGGGVLFGAESRAFALIKGYYTNGSGNGFGDLVVSTRNAPTDSALTERLRITGDGNIGIGTSSPIARLHVKATTNDTFFVNGHFNLSDGVTLFAVNEVANAVMGMEFGASSYYFGGGNLGVGTTAPAARLEVNGSGALQDALRVTGSDPANARVNLRNTNGMQFGLISGVVGITNSGFSIRDLTNSADRLMINSSGNVGIGNVNPAEKLEVTGNIKVDGTGTTGNITAGGTITGNNIIAKYQDVAEWVESSQSLPAGTVVVLDHTKSNQVIASSKSYDTRVAGVISANSGIALGEQGEDKVLVATTGRVRVRVDASPAPIEVGDLLVTSNQEGVAMKSLPIDIGGVQIHRPGTLIGKALEPLAKGQGEILVLLSLQ